MAQCHHVRRVMLLIKHIQGTIGDSSAKPEDLRCLRKEWRQVYDKGVMETGRSVRDASGQAWLVTDARGCKKPLEQLRILHRDNRGKILYPVFMDPADQSMPYLHTEVEAKTIGAAARILTTGYPEDSLYRWIPSNMGWM